MKRGIKGVIVFLLLIALWVTVSDLLSVLNVANFTFQTENVYSIVIGFMIAIVISSGSE